MEYLLWAINRDTYVEAIVATNLTQWGWTDKLATKAINRTTGQPDYPPVMIPGNGVQLDEIGQLPAKGQPPPVMGGPPPIMVEGYHVNMRIYESQLRDALDAYIPTLPFVQADHGVPAAEMDANGMKWLKPYLADGVTPAIATRRRVWA